jgi:hypothetical protein
MYSTAHLANQYNWLPAAPIVNQGISNWSGPPSNIPSGFGPPFENGVNAFPSSGYMGDFIQDGQMPVPGMMMNPWDPEQKYGVGSFVRLIFTFISWFEKVGTYISYAFRLEFCLPRRWIQRILALDISRYSSREYTRAARQTGPRSRRAIR